MATKERAKILTYFWYAKEAEEAARLYASIFPDSRIDGIWALQSESPGGPAGSVKVVDFTLLDQRFQTITAGPTTTSTTRSRSSSNATIRRSSTATGTR